MIYMDKINLKKRLRAVASFVRQGSLPADIGTDHAYLPIWLIKNKIVTDAIACDINRKPCIRAENNINKYKLQSNINVIQSNGLRAIEGFAPTDIIIAGMGGDLIIRIIDESEYLKNLSVRLILQPMTRLPKVREYLTNNGFDIVGESMVEEDDRIYQIICAEYIGKNIEYSDVELLIGRHNIMNHDELFEKIVLHNINSVETRIRGKSNVGLETEDDIRLLNGLRDLL